MNKLTNKKIAEMIGINDRTFKYWQEGYTVRKSLRGDELPKDELKTRRLAIEIGTAFIANGFGYSAATSIIEENIELKKEIHNYLDKIEAVQGVTKQVRT